jgi:glycosyltransferase involved in cell wall biosynthesis
MKPRVLMTTTAYPPSIGGVQGFVADLCNGLQHFDADVATLWLEHRTDWLLGTTIRLGEPDHGGSPGVQRLGWSRKARLRMAPWVAAYYAAVPLAARQIAAAMVPSLERVVTPDHALIHNHRIGREFLARASLVVARKRGLPFVLTPYHHPRWHGYRYSGWTSVYRAADAVLTLTEAEAHELKRLGVRDDRIHVIRGAADEPIPADASRFRARIGGGDRPIVLFLGQLYAYKGVAQLVAAADALAGRGRQMELVFVGPGTSFSRHFFTRQSRPWLHVLGGVDNQTKWDALEAASIVCVPSEQESFGRVYLEAWSKSKPVIGARIPAVTEVITEGKTGLLVEAGSIAELERALDRLLADSELAARLGAAGRIEVEGRFSWREVVARVEAVYGSLLEKAPAPLRSGPETR